MSHVMGRSEAGSCNSFWTNANLPLQAESYTYATHWCSSCFEDRIITFLPVYNLVDLDNTGQPAAYQGFLESGVAEGHRGPPHTLPLCVGRGGARLRDLELSPTFSMPGGRDGPTDCPNIKTDDSSHPTTFHIIYLHYIDPSQQRAPLSKIHNSPSLSSLYEAVLQSVGPIDIHQPFSVYPIAFTFLHCPRRPLARVPNNFLS